jgi:hypothetical protein
VWPFGVRAAQLYYFSNLSSKLIHTSSFSRNNELKKQFCSEQVERRVQQKNSGVTSHSAVSCCLTVFTWVQEQSASYLVTHFKSGVQVILCSRRIESLVCFVHTCCIFATVLRFKVLTLYRQRYYRCALLTSVRGLQLTLSLIERQNTNMERSPSTMLCVEFI